MGRCGMTRFRLALGALCAISIWTGTALAGQPRSAGLSDSRVETVLFRQGEDGYKGCADTRISQEAPNRNFGNEELVLGMKGRVGVLIRFEVSSLPANAVIEEATLGLYVSNYGQRTEPITTGAYPVLRSWDEMEATWNKATDAEDWGAPGCNHLTTDRDATPLDEAMIFERDDWPTWSVTTAVQQWVNDPVSNRGLLIRQIGQEIGGEFDIRESEYPGVQVHPYLLVAYSLATPTPTSTSTPSAPPTPTNTPTQTYTPTPPPLPCVGTPEPGAVLVVLQQGPEYSGVEDTSLDFDDRGYSYADEWYTRVGYRRHWSTLIKYDVSTIPEGSRIVCAALSMYAERWSGSPLDVGAYYVRRENQVDQATWTYAAPSVPWQEGGCNGPDDRAQTPESTVLVHTIYKWYDWDLTDAVDGWVNGWLANNGVSLQAVDLVDTDTVWFTSSDDEQQHNRPRLAVLYVPTGEATATSTLTATPTHTTTMVPSSTPTPTVSPTPTSSEVPVLFEVYLPIIEKSTEG